MAVFFIRLYYFSLLKLLLPDIGFSCVGEKRKPVKIPPHGTKEIKLVYVNG
jgi:hypothetical protein